MFACSTNKHTLFKGLFLTGQAQKKNKNNLHQLFIKFLAVVINNIERPLNICLNYITKFQTPILTILYCWNI